MWFTTLILNIELYLRWHGCLTLSNNAKRRQINATFGMKCYQTQNKRKTSTLVRFSLYYGVFLWSSFGKDGKRREAAFALFLNPRKLSGFSGN